ncbi:TldD/PmbA family protein [bacterium]|nr:TldD/PmbA family protein [candidate division CSSED10-310 bacterium]
MKEHLKKAVASSDAHYRDAMFHSARHQSIIYNKLDLHNVSNTLISGGRCSVVNGGGFGAVSFTAPEGVTEALRGAERAAAAMTAFTANARLAPAPVVVDDVRLTPEMDPRGVSFEEKCALIEDYTRLLLGIDGITTTTVGYHETFNDKWFVNSEGTVIAQEELVCRIGGRIIVQGNGTTEMLGFSYGYDSDFSKLLNRHAELEGRAKTALGLLHATPVRPGNHTVICDSELGGVFVHEAFGHLSESDDIVYNPSLHAAVSMGRQIGSPILNIIDRSDLAGAPGSYVYDDEGVRGTRTYLVKDGILSGRLMSRMTATLLDGAPTGNYRAMDYRFMPLVRMSNIYIDTGETPFEQMLAGVDRGLYLCGGKGGQTMGDIFTFGAQYGFEITNGRLGGMVKNINIAGNVFTTLGNIQQIGDTLHMSEWGGCGKSRAALYDMQMLDKSGLGSPHILIRNVIIGG